MHTLVKPPTSFLDAITTPAELKKMAPEQLQRLAEEIRQEIISNLSKTGGHLASNLGIVEITLALHHVFTTPRDQILWDVGHQAYVHKLLTGRRDRFQTLRQFKGLSGFIHPLESEHDAFVAGHSSTSVSLAVGMAIARDHLLQNHKVIAVIGDGGLTGGMALEAINHLGHIQRDVLIILNDNEMSISENLGGFAQYMKRIKETFFYKDIKQKLDLIEDRLDEIALTPAVWDLISSVKKQAKERFDTPGIVFEKLGINYSGPIDGHDVGAVIQALKRVQDKRTPQILHLITQKGKGYAPAERDSIKYHGVPAFSLEPPLSEKLDPAQPAAPKAKTYSEVFTQSLIDLAEIEPNLVAITPATAEGSGLVKFGKVFPDRFFDVAICEQHAVTMAAGMAKAGLKPVVSIYSTFLQRAMDQVIHDVAILNLPVVFGIDRGGLVEDGETHQGVFDIAYLRSIPNFTVLAPKDARELRNMVYTAIKESAGPVAIRFPREKASGITAGGTLEGFEHLNYSKWEVLEAGKAVDGAAPQVLLAYGAMVEICRQAMPLLNKAGLAPMLVNARSAKPLDGDFLSKLVAPNVRDIITLEEGCLAGGFGAAVLEWMASNSDCSPQPRIKRIAVPDRFVEHGARSILLDINGLSPHKVAETIKRFTTT
ncbi:MAG TPA: 1-deoxy-D-xylulose-5-phosphate synthase [Candidatus Obscuribacterales bacterium]